MVCFSAESMEKALVCEPVLRIVGTRGLQLRSPIQELILAQTRGLECRTLKTAQVIREAWLSADKNEASWQDYARFAQDAAQALRGLLAQSVFTEEDGDFRFTIDPDRDHPVRSAYWGRLDEALTRLECINSKQSRIVELRFFGGMPFEEVASLLNCSFGAVKRDWFQARAWLYQQMDLF